MHTKGSSSSSSAPPPLTFGPGLFGSSPPLPFGGGSTGSTGTSGAGAGAGGSASSAGLFGSPVAAFGPAFVFTASAPSGSAGTRAGVGASGSLLSDNPFPAAGGAGPNAGGGAFSFASFSNPSSSASSSYGPRPRPAAAAFSFSPPASPPPASPSPRTLPSAPRLPPNSTLQEARGAVAELAVALAGRPHGGVFGHRVLRAADRRAAMWADKGASWVDGELRLVSAQLALGDWRAALMVLVALATEVPAWTPAEASAVAELQAIASGPM